MIFSNRRKLEKKVIALYRQKFTQKEIAKTIGITEKTVRAWLVDFRQKEAGILSKIKALDTRLDLMLKNPSTSSEEIKNITLSITALENRLNKY